MNATKKTTAARPPSLVNRLLPSFAALLCTLIAAPLQAVTFPAVPLQSGAAYPPANIMFILDDSGSMSSDYMPDVVPSTSPVNIALNAYPRNTLYYDPSINYLPWMKSDGTRYTGGTAYTSAYSDSDELLSAVDLSNNTRTFYVPKTGATNMALTASYYRYQIPAGGGDMVRSEYGAATQSGSGFPMTGLTDTAGAMTPFSFPVPANVNSLTVTTAGGSYGTNGGANNGIGNGAELYVRSGAAPTTGTYTCRSIGGGNGQSCTINNPAAGTWYVGVYRSSNYKNVTLDVSFDIRCGSGSGSNDWINCTSATPTGRTLANELTNYATWYSYFRTRIKLAKAGASEAFGQIGSNLRVGFDTIWARNRFPIPVGTNNGQFTGTNRDTWYARLVAATASGYTPLKGALQRNGEYFSDTSATGPWGPETGSDQISCRQNFSILTTDGYWNSNSGYTSPVGDADGTAGPTITSPTGGSFTFNATNPYKDNFSTNPNTQPNTLADVAMYYWKRDLVTTLPNNVPTSVADPAFWQHMVTFSVSIGQQGTLNPKTDLPGITNGSLHWPDPTPTENATRIDDLWHAAVNGRGSFVAANNPNEFAQGLVDALATVAARLGSASNVTANSTSFTSDTRVFQASYVSGKWTGELSAYDATQAGVSSTPAWQAGALIPTSGRNIITWNGSAGATFPTVAQTTALARTTGLAPVTGASNAAYIAGATTLEKRNGGTLRDRASLLGDIAYSSPMYVKDSETIFVGANDGMLHAFNALTGAERFAYVPGGISLPNLATLSDPQYTHQYFVDGPVAVSTLKQTPGKNYFVGSLGRGGKGVFGLDVTNPGSFGASNALWERTSDADMGQVLGEPLVVTLNDGTKAVLVSNGVNSSTHTAALFILNIATGAVIKEINTNVGNAGSENGLFAPRGWDEDGNGTVDYVYAGDLKGNLWKFDLSGATSSSWNLALSGVPLFTTQSGQPITAGLGLARDPLTGKRWIFVGTGSFLTTGDSSDNTVQSMYGLIDDGTSTAVQLSDLVKRNIVVTGTVNGKAVRGFEANSTINPAKKGWYIDLDNPTPGERIVSNPRVKGAALLVASIIPPSTNTCDAGGTGYINALDAFSGTSLTQPFFDVNGDGQVNASDQINDSNGNPVPVGSVDLGVGMPTLPTVIDKLLVVGGSKGSLGSVLVNPQGGSNQRISWHEILRD
ncbi:PilC/PilY family type IV pilus protein [Cognatiluteimonas profundi]|uniref:PilC/PilY family type IV pilus protein n=1 Tax=Cognatiluteimonas profundi TaxID=2594501 RepID=UPI00131ADCE8|nr:PilC/PilY family type IV pilus protein [Lysobacter profundi]